MAMKMLRLLHSQKGSAVQLKFRLIWNSKNDHVEYKYSLYACVYYYSCTDFFPHCVKSKKSQGKKNLNITMVEV